MTDRILEDNNDFSSLGIIFCRTRPRATNVVQLYQDQDFLNRAVCRFAGAAMANGEGLPRRRSALECLFAPFGGRGVNVKAAQASGQLTVVDADENCRASWKRPCRTARCSSGLPEK